MSCSGRHSSRIMHLLECVFLLWSIAYALRSSSPVRVIPLLSISSPCRGNIFFRYMERTRRRLVIEAALEESRIVALVL